MAVDTPGVEADRAFAAMPGAPDFLPKRQCIWLLRPIVDLGGFEIGPFYSAAIEHHWQAMRDTTLPPFSLQRTLPRGFRSSVLREADRSDLVAADPRDLRTTAGTDRWRELCDLIDRWHQLPPDCQCRLLRLLHALTFYEMIMALVPSPPHNLDALDPIGVDIVYSYASAKYMLGVPMRVADYAHADLAHFEAIANTGGHAPIAAFNAALKLLIHRSKCEAGADELERRAQLAERCLARACAVADTFDAVLLSSRYHRALAFLPMRRGDRHGVIRHMDLAEHHARVLLPETSAQVLLYRENLHPVMESRAKEAVWLGDPERALVHARAVVELDSHDPKSWLELGQIHVAQRHWQEAATAYVAAARLGPPVGAIAHHMSGVCFAHLGQSALAAFFFQRSLEIDPLGISPRATIQALPTDSAFDCLKEWAARRLERRSAHKRLPSTESDRRRAN